MGSNLIMEQLAKSVDRRAPVCGILSVAAPFASLPAGLVADKAFQILYPNDQGWLSGIAFVALPILGCFIGGLILSGAAALRVERYSVLGWIGLLLNAAPLSYLMMAAAR